MDSHRSTGNQRGYVKDVVDATKYQRFDPSEFTIIIWSRSGIEVGREGERGGDEPKGFLA
jgi:hypothetical protein